MVGNSKLNSYVPHYDVLVSAMSLYIGPAGISSYTIYRILCYLVLLDDTSCTTIYFFLSSRVCCKFATDVVITTFFDGIASLHVRMKNLTTRSRWI